MSTANIAEPASGSGRPRVAGLPSVSPRILVAAGVVVVAASLVGIYLAPAALRMPLDELQQLGATAATAIALLLASRAATDETRFATRGLALAALFVGLGMLVWDLQPGSWSQGAGPGDALFAASFVTLVVTFARGVFGGMDRSRIAEIVLDTSILLIATATVLVVAWRTVIDPEGRDETVTAIAISTVGGIAGPVAVFLALLDRRVRPSLSGVYAALTGVGILSLSMVSWEILQSQGFGSSIGLCDYLYSAGVLLVGYGGCTWTLRVTVSPRFTKLAQASVDILPLFAVALCVAILLLVPRTPGLGIEEIGTGAVVLLALTRQVLLTGTERRARAAEHDASLRLEREIRARGSVLQSLGRLDAAHSAEETARRMCQEALRLDGIDRAVVWAFASNGEVEVVGVDDVSGRLGDPGTKLRPEQAQTLIASAVAGPWTDTLDFPLDPARSLPGLEIPTVMANAPLLWNDQVIGVIGLGGICDATGPVIDERLTTAREFGVVAGALLGPALAERGRLEELHQSVSHMIESLAFHPVFQPIVDLATQRTVGYEALTRFDNGQRPDLLFADAAAVGLGRALESACLRAALCDAIALPADAWLSLNVSPELAVAQLPLLAVLEACEREIVLEITEHAPVESYADLTAALDLLRSQVRIAVDDAGAGYAGLQHILEIRPDIVKLDIALVRGVDGDPVRRALVAGMVAFAREGGCSLLAEGIETDSELSTLQTLGVALGQGYLLGRPASIDALPAARAA